MMFTNDAYEQGTHMKLLFKFDNSSYYKSKCVFLNDKHHDWRDEYIRIYLDTLTFDSGSILANSSVDRDYISTDVMDAIIQKDKVYLGFDLYLPEDRSEDYDPTEKKFYVVDRLELLYLVKHWYKFLKRDQELKIPDYQEIINSEDAYI